MNNNILVNCKTQKVIGFEFVKEFIKNYPNFNVFVSGSSSSFLHMLCCDQELPLNDVDFNIISNHDDKFIHNELIKFSNYFCNKNSVTFEIDTDVSIGYIYIKNSSTVIVELNYFINQIEIPYLTNISGIKTITFQEALENEKHDVKIFTEIVSTSNDEDEIKMLTDKLSRKTIILSCMKNVF